MQQLQQLNDKLNLLMEKYTALEAENRELRDAAQKNADVTPGEKDKMRKQIDTVIGEIDKILTTLHD